MSDPDRMVTVRADDLAACLNDAGSHLGYWGVSEEYEARLEAALEASADE